MKGRCRSVVFGRIDNTIFNGIFFPWIISRLHELGRDVGSRVIDLYFVRERNSKRETKLINMLLFIKTTLWKCLFGKEAEKLEHANDDDRTYYIIEKDPLVNKFISVPKDKGSLNCATFSAGIIEAVLSNCGFVSIKFRFRLLAK